MKFYLLAFVFICSMILAGLVLAQGLPDIPVPDDFYDGGARKAQVDAIPGAPSVSASVDGLTNTVTIAVHGQSGNALSGRYLARVWTAATSMGAPSTDNVESLTLSGGTAVQQVVEHADYVYLTGANGTASAAIVGTAAGTNYVMVAVGGYVTAAAVVFEE